VADHPKPQRPAIAVAHGTADIATCEMLVDRPWTMSMSALFDGVVSAKFDGFPVSRPYAP
jgi:hypothetical protein